MQYLNVVFSLWSRFEQAHSNTSNKPKSVVNFKEKENLVNWYDSPLEAVQQVEHSQQNIVKSILCEFVIVYIYCFTFHLGSETIVLFASLYLLQVSQ